MIYDVFINDRYWKTFDFPRAVRTPLGRIMFAIRAARDAGDLAAFESPEGVFTVRIEPQKIV